VRHRPKRIIQIILVLSLVPTGCTGLIDDPSAGGDGVTRSPDSVSLCGSEIDPGPSTPLRRLTRAEYDNTVRDLLGDDTGPAQSFPADEEGGGFDLGATVSPLQFELYMNAAEGVAERAVVERLESLLPCDPAVVGRDACALELIDSLGTRAYRRPLSSGQRDRLLAVYDLGKTEGFENGIRLVISAMLQSPAFLYRIEEGSALDSGDGSVVALDGYERASKLSYLLWGTMPDEELFALAATDALATPEAVAEHARRMLDDPRSREAVGRFISQWLHLDLEGVEKDPELYPQFDDALRASMAASIEAFIDHVMWEQNGSLTELLTADYAFVDERLAAIYGIEGVTGDALVRRDVNTAERLGLLTHPALLSVLSLPNQSSPVERGAFVRQQLFCQHLPPPPEDLVVVPPDPDPSMSTRDRFIAHREDPACAGCHQLMDPIGFGLENYDAIGMYRLEEENGQPVDARGELFETDQDGPFEGGTELSSRLSESEMVRRCVTEQWFRFTFGRTQSAEEECMLDDVYTAFEASDWDIREALIALTRTDAFLYRRAEESR
jgi:hypothetical protein